MTKTEYHQYLKSVDWMLKKHELISVYLKNDWPIDCFSCHGTQGLQVHHLSYEDIGNESVSDLVFACDECHKRLHFENGFYETWSDFLLERSIAILVFLKPWLKSKS